MRGFTIFILSLAFFVSFSTVCNASISREMTYKESVVWRGAVRFVRVDKHFKIIEKDRESGYLLFEYKDAQRKYTASLEVIKVVKNGYHYVRVQLNIEDMPMYVENVFFDHFVKKLKTEHGIPPVPQKVYVPKPDKNNDDHKSDKKTNDDSKKTNDDDLNDNDNSNNDYHDNNEE